MIICIFFWISLSFCHSVLIVSRRVLCCLFLIIPATLPLIFDYVCISKKSCVTIINRYIYTRFLVFVSIWLMCSPAFLTTDVFGKLLVTMFKALSSLFFLIHYYRLISLWSFSEPLSQCHTHTLTHARTHIPVFFQPEYLKITSSISYHIYQPLRSSRIWHKVNFLNGI